jgi:cytochrome c oxidase subunit 2
VPTIKVLFELNATPKDPLVVNVFGQQWWWEFDYPSIKGGDNLPLVTANEMVIPAGRQVKLNITSRDVIHSFWIPSERFKRDAFPQRWTEFDLTFAKPGTYVGRCAEFCGLQHAGMGFTVEAT